MLPETQVQSGDYLYFDSYCGSKSASDAVSYTVEIKTGGTVTTGSRSYPAKR